MSVNDHQVGGDHYAQGGKLQHWDFVAVNGLGYLEGCATKYISRWRKKHGVNDLQKAQHYVQKMIELVSTGRLGCPHRGTLAITVKAFAEANGLSALEQALCWDLTHWHDISVLRSVDRRLGEMIDDLGASKD